MKEIPENYEEKITKFLEKFEHYELSYNITTVPIQKFNLAIKLGKLKDAYELANQNPTSDKMKMVADLALDQGEFSLAEEALRKAKDYNGLLLFYSWLVVFNK